MNNDETTDNRIDRIREILFGNQLSEITARIERLEKRLEENYEQINKELSRRFDDVVNLLNNGMDGLTNKLQEEERQRENTFNALSQSNVSNLQDMSERVSALNKKTTAVISDIQEQLHDGLQQLDEQLSKSLEEVDRAMQKNAEELSNKTNTNRQELSNLFAELSNWLQHERVISDKK